MKSKLFTIFLALAASVGTMFAESGTCGENLTWDLTNGVLTISGTGTMTNWSSPSSVPWYSYCPSITEVSIGNSVTSIGSYAFYRCSGLTSIEIPNSITSIGEWAFAECPNLTSVTIPNSVTSIGGGTFYRCTGLTSVIIGNSVTSIGKCAFYYCFGLTSIEIPNSVTNIGEDAFIKCTGLLSITIPNSVTSIGNNAFSCVHNIFYNGTATGSPWGADNININGYVDGYLMYSDSAKTTLLACSSAATGEITLPNSITTISKRAFENCFSLTSVIIPNSVTNIGWNAFDMVPNIVYNGSATNSPWGARSQNGHVDGGLVYSDNSKTNLLACSSEVTGEIIIPNSVTSIGDYAFKYCTGLTSVTIPNSVTSFGANFYYCGLREVTFWGTIPASGTFEFCPFLNAIYVPCGTLDAYKQAWTADTGKIKYAPNPYYIYLSVNNSDAGDVVCHTQNLTICDQSATIEATPNYYGYHFVQWSDGNTDNPRTIWLSKDTTFTAEFAKNEYSIATESSNTAWGITAGDTMALYLDHVTISATPNYGYHFVHWNDNNESNPRSVVLSQDSTFVATFAKNTYSVTKIANSTQGSISGKSSAEYLDEVELTATPKYGYHFVQWSDGNKENPLPFVLTKDTTFTAEFAKNTYSIATASSNPAWGSTAGDYSALYLDELEISASAIYGYHFDHWNDGNNENPRTITVTEDKTYTATFAKNVYGVTKQCNSEQGYITGVSQAEYLDYVTLEVFPNYSYRFVQWSDGIKDNPRTFVLTQDTTFTAEFAANLKITYICNNTMGSVSGATTAMPNEEVTFTAIPNANYHFVQWLDGNIDNPRTIVLTRDTAFAAVFAIDKSGKCGDNLALTWEYDSNAKELTISGNGTLNSNYTFGLEAPSAVEKLIIADGVTTIGNSAFAEYSTLKHISVSASVETIYEQAFYNCTGLQEIYSYGEIPSTAYSNTFDGINKFKCTLHVLSSSVDMYKAATGWRDFYYVEPIGAEEATTSTDEVTVETTDNTATMTWPTDDNAASYTIQITKDGVLFCTLIFNGNGQLIGIAFAPSRDRQSQLLAAKQVANGLQFTVTGLNSATHYAFSLTAKDSQETVLASYTGEFTTTGVATGIDQITNDKSQTTKIIKDNQIFILRGDKVYTITGQEVR